VQFPLAPMSLDISIMTWMVLALPLGLFAAALGAPRPARFVLFGVTAFVVLIYGTVALWWRPLRFEVGGHSLMLVWPLRSRLVEGRQIKSVEILPRAEFRRRYGWGYRVGAGGLWGGFGLLVTSRESFAMYVSRTDRFVVVRLRTGRPLLVTPAEPERFVAALQRAAAA
jgi:hypothetical protein